MTVDKDAVKTAGLIGKDDLLAKLHFIFEFKAKESSVLNILDRLAAHKMFVVVSSLQFEKMGMDVKKHKKPIDRDREKLTEEARGPEEIPSRLERLLSGPALEKPMNVTIEMDVYRFKGE